MQVLVSSPEVDNITRYLHVWSKKLIKTFENKHSFIHLEGEHATQSHFCGLLRKNYPTLVLINGHGNSAFITGHNREKLLDIKNVSLLKDKNVHALSCKTAQKLGPAAIKAGAKSYIGYDENFVLIMREGNLQEPLKDDLAKLFLDPAFTAPKSLLTGKTPKEAVKQAKVAFQNSIAAAMNSDIQSDQEKCVPYLIHDLLHLKCLENEQ